ncbi:MAG: GDP-mannose 4,6-dehydratase, partial [Candidatus Odinarchaeia archaeon]
MVNKRILVTGGMGFIGGHLVDTLIKRGDEVIIIDNLSSSITEVYNNFLKCKNITF